MNALTLYFIGLCDDVSAFFIILFVISMGLYLAKLFHVCGKNDHCRYCEHNPSHKDMFKYPPVSWLLANVLVALIIVFIPSSKTLTLMVTIPAVTQNENFKQLPNDIVVYLRKLISDYTKEEKSK